MTKPRIAIACQGGGSHAAFTAGVLAALLGPGQRERFELVALSGTSGGAVCAAVAWSGLLAAGPEEAVRRLDGFWTDLAASAPVDVWLNAVLQLSFTLPFTPRSSPYAYSPAAEPRLRELLRRWMRPDALPADAASRSRPYLRLGAADVLGPGGVAFAGEDFTLDDVIASAAVPPLFRAVAARGGLWWDGLYAHNPPIRHLLELPDKPAEIWVVRLNPERQTDEPTTADAIEDRRNEKAGNLPLDQEVFLVRTVNKALAAAPELGPRFGWRPITVRQVELDLPGLDYASKLDRSASHLAALRAAGRAAAGRFFDDASIIVPPQG
jgi:NTE family protein